VARNGLYSVLAFVVLALVVGPIGIAVFVLGFIHGDSPCVLCWAQRTQMVLIALVSLFVLRYGPRPRYLGLGILVAGGGVYMGIRHSALHLWRDVGQGFSAEILGAHTYTWSAFIFWVAVLTMGLLVMALRDGEAAATTRRLRPLDRAAMALFLVAVAGNIVQAFASTGPPPYMGQGDPIRFSFNPRNWVWSLEEWSPSPISLRGRWGIEKPSAASISGDPAAGPLADLPVMQVTRQSRLGTPVDGAVTGFAHEEETDRFLVTTGRGIYIFDGDPDRVVRRATIDPGFSVDLARFGGAAFLEPGVVMAVSENKSFVILRENDEADAAANYRFFVESFDRFDEVRRSRFTTVRAKMMYVLSLAFDPQSSSLYTVTVPNRWSRQLVVSRFDRRDLTLSEEFLPALAPASGLAFSDTKRSLNELYVTGATVREGRLYALSAAHGTLVEMDPASRSIVRAWVVPDLDRPAGIAFRGSDLYVIAEDGGITVAGMPQAGAE